MAYDSVNKKAFELFLTDKKKKINIAYSFFSKNFEIYQKGNIGLDYSHLPANVSLFPSYPNPFNPTTNLSFDIPDQNKLITTKLSIFNLRGQEVKTLINGNITPGHHQMYWNAEGSPSGVYFVPLQYGNKVQVMADNGNDTQSPLYFDYNYSNSLAFTASPLPCSIALSILLNLVSSSFGLTAGAACCVTALATSS